MVVGGGGMVYVVVGGCVWWWKGAGKGACGGRGGKGVCGGGREGGRVRVVVEGCMCVVVEGRGEGCVWWCKGVCGGARVCVVHMWNGVSEN